MADDLDDLLILRKLDEPIDREGLDAAEQSGETLPDLRDEGVGIEWIDSEVLTNGNGAITGTACHYWTESEDAIKKHADRTGLPPTKVSRRGEPLEGE